MKMNIKRIFENKKKIFAEISNSLANEILVKSTQNLDVNIPSISDYIVRRLCFGLIGIIEFEYYKFSLLAELLED